MFLSQATATGVYELELGEAYNLQFDSFDLKLSVQLYFVLAVCVHLAFTS